MALALCALAALGAAAPGASARPGDARESRYSLAGGCHVLRSEAASRFVARAGAGYAAAARRAGGAERFRMQATDLGEYLLFGERRDFLAAAASRNDVESAAEPSKRADWRVEPAGAGRFRIALRAGGRVLAVGSRGDRLVVEGPRFRGQRALFAFVSARGCPRYPEIGTQTAGKPFTGKTPYGGVRGLLDPHLHLGAFEFLGGAHCGRPWHRYGAPYALVDCPDHQPNGATAVLENALSGNPARTHDTTGWPTFEDWPEDASQTHEQTYYKWIERAWRGGLRLIVNDLVENRALCELYPPTNERARGKSRRCDEMASARLQLRRMHELEDYIDAQEGGPGRGWFRIVDDPFQARRVINDGKVAVVMGIEVSELFGCGLGPGPDCDRASLRRELDRFYDLGVRSLFPVHKFDNALGGTRFDGGETGAVVNAGNFYATGRFWDAETCTGDQHDNEQTAAAPDAPGVIAAGFAALTPKALPAIPVYPPPPHCNTRGLTDLGEYLIRLMMKRGMIVEPDHMSVRAQRRTLAMLEARGYSGVIASHSWSDPHAWPRIYRLGGIVSPITKESHDFVEEWRELRRVRSRRFYFGVGYGADSNGLHSQPPPREDANVNPVTYPFKSFDGGTTLRRQRSGQRSFDINTGGVDHYGLHPDWVEDLGHVTGDRIVRDLGRGAEAYLQMWERAVGVPAERCRKSRARLRRAGLGSLRLGQRPQRVLVRSGQPADRDGRAFRYCVERSGKGKGRGKATLGAVFAGRGRLAVIATDARGYRLRGVRPGDPAAALRGSARFGRGLRVERAGGGRAFVYRVGGGRVRAVGVAKRPATKSPARLGRYLRLALRR